MADTDQTVQSTIDPRARMIMLSQTLNAIEYTVDDANLSLEETLKAQLAEFAGDIAGSGNEHSALAARGQALADGELTTDNLDGAARWLKDTFETFDLGTMGEDEAQILLANYAGRTGIDLSSSAQPENGESAPESDTTVPDVDPGQFAEAQTYLAVLGYNEASNIDGIPGAKSTAAIQAYAEDNPGAAANMDTLMDSLRESVSQMDPEDLNNGLSELRAANENFANIDESFSETVAESVTSALETVDTAIMQGRARDFVAPVAGLEETADIDMSLTQDIQEVDGWTGIDSGTKAQIMQAATEGRNIAEEGLASTVEVDGREYQLYGEGVGEPVGLGGNYHVQGAVDLTATREAAQDIHNYNELRDKIFNKATQDGYGLKQTVEVDGTQYAVEADLDGQNYEMTGFEELDPERVELRYSAEDGQTRQTITDMDHLKDTVKENLNETFASVTQDGYGDTIDNYAELNEFLENGVLTDYRGVLTPEFQRSTQQTNALLGPDRTPVQLSSEFSRQLSDDLMGRPQDVTVDASAASAGM